MINAENIAREVELNEELDQYQYELDNIKKSTRYWHYGAVFWLVVLIIILLYSCAAKMKQEPVVEYYKATLKADMLGVSTEGFETITTDELLEASIENGYVSNCSEFYYDPSDSTLYSILDGSTTYYSVDSLEQAIAGSPLTYRISQVEKAMTGSDSVTEVVTTDFTYGFNDGSCQMAIPETEDLVFSGYSKRLLEGYMSSVKSEYVTNKPVTLVISGSHEVDENLVSEAFKGVFTDVYKIGEDAGYYGLYSDGEVIEYIKTNGEKVNILGCIEENLESYLGCNLDVSCSVPAEITESLTVISINTENYAYDDFYIANKLNLY